MCVLYSKTYVEIKRALSRLGLNFFGANLVSPVTSCPSCSCVFILVVALALAGIRSGWSRSGVRPLGCCSALPASCSGGCRSTPGSPPSATSSSTRSVYIFARCVPLFLFHSPCWLTAVVPLTIPLLLLCSDPLHLWLYSRYPPPQTSDSLAC